MKRTTHIKDLIAGWQTIVMFALLGLVLALIVSFIQPLRYASTARLLVLQTGSDVDAYTASRAEERIADNLSTIIFTSTFFDRVVKSGFDIDQTAFPQDPSKRRRVWNRTIDATVSRGSGLLSITAYNGDVARAEQIVRAIAFVLTDRVDEYTSGANVRVRLVDEPLNSRFPVKPNVLANALSGLFLGGFIGALYVMVQTERIRRRHQFIHR
jgi:capsular polysaccharide biosynthesis protein